MRNKKGAAIVYALAIIFMLGILLSGLTRFVSSRITAGSRSEAKQDALQVAEAGVFFYRWYLAHETDGRTAQQIDDFWTSGSPLGIGSDYEATYSDPWGSAIGMYSIHVDPPVSGSTIANVTVTGWTNKYPNIKRTIKVRFRRPSWSESVVLADDFMRFGDGTILAGKIHSNGGIRLDGIATGMVTGTPNTFNDPDHTGANEIGVHTHKLANGTVNDTFRVAESNPDNIPDRPDVFQAGRRINIPRIPFENLVSDLGFMRSEAAIKYDNSGLGRRIILKSDGTFDMCKVNSYSTTSNGITNYTGTVVGASGAYAGTNGTSCTTNSCCLGGSCPLIQASRPARGRCVSLTNTAIPNNGIIFVANNVWLEGTINNKKVSVVAAELTDEPGYTGGGKNVFVGMDNILYTNTDGSDILGIIAQNDIEVIRDSLSNLTIYGALLAKEGRVGREAYNSNKSTITIIGSIATKIRYGFAYVGSGFSCGGGVTVGDGYCFRNISFDDDLLYYPPPYFPTGTQYSIDLWDEI